MFLPPSHWQATNALFQICTEITRADRNIRFQ